MIFYMVYALWLFSEILLNRLVRSGKTDKQSADKHTELYLWVTIITAVSLGACLSFTIYAPLAMNENVRYAGLAIIVAGMLFRFIAIRQLGRYFTVDVTIRKDHHLMQAGLYKYLRHPSYTGLLVSFAGLGLALNNWISLLVIIIPIVAVFLLRIRTEENALISRFGEDYRQYASRTKRLIPFIY